MTTGTGLMLMGVWVCIGLMWHSPAVRGDLCVIATFGAVIVSTVAFFVH